MATVISDAVRPIVAVADQDKIWKDFAIPLVAQFEGCARRGRDGLIYPYLDKLAKPPVWTRGYGRTYGIAEDSAGITREQALEELGVGLERYARQCAALAPGLVASPKCLAAVTSWAWNCGIGAFQRSRLRSAINQDRWIEAGQFMRTPRTAGGVEVRGLARRRDAEVALFLEGCGEE